MNIVTRRRISIALFLLSVASAAKFSAATPQSRTLQGWETYVQWTEKRINDELNSKAGFLRLDFKPPEDRARIRKALSAGRVFVEQMNTKDPRGQEIKAEDGMIHHWYGAILVPDVRLNTLITWLQNYDHHSEYFPEVQRSRLVKRDGDNFKIFLRLMRKKVVTVYYDTEHTVIYRKHTGARISSRSVADRIAELSDEGTEAEREKTSAGDSGFLWRLHSYWRFEQTDEGVVIECESISLSRSIPFGFGWLVGPFVESVPRESLDTMLTSIKRGVVS